MKKEISIKERLKLLPALPGCYLMYDKNDNIIYVGKAKKLKNRVKSYFCKTLDTPKLRVMVPQIVRFEFVITDSEIEALILESHLIKKHKPKYNILLKDDKKFPWFYITEEEYPQILITRRNKDAPKRGKYFGPYTNSKAMYATLEHLKKLFPLKQCKSPRFKDRPCIYYQIGKCSGPCQKLISPENYQKIVEQVELYLSGRQNELIEELKKQMEICAKNEQFEKAALYRDGYFNIKQALERQKVVDDSLNLYQDIIGLTQDEIRFVISLLEIRSGRLINKKSFEIIKDETSIAEEAITSFMKNYYILKDNDLPKEILIPQEINKEENELFENWLGQKRGGGKVNIIVAQKGKKHDLIELAKKNAEAYLEELKIKDIIELQSEWNLTGSYIKEKLGLKKFPHVVECFDISHFQGTNTVASMVVFEDGKPSKSKYKKFKIKTTEGKPDDFLSMLEVMTRRYTRLLKENQALPDLIIIDGGKGQLTQGVKVLKNLGIKEQDIVSLAKRLEEIFIPKEKLPVILPYSSPALFFFQKIRDEAHRFAITFHRKLRETQALSSILDNIPYLGESRKKRLFEKFKDIKGILSAHENELSEVIGPRATKSLIERIKSL